VRSPRTRFLRSSGPTMPYVRTCSLYSRGLAPREDRPRRIIAEGGVSLCKRRRRATARGRSSCRLSRQRAVRPFPCANTVWAYCCCLLSRLVVPPRPPSHSWSTPLPDVGRRPVFILSRRSFSSRLEGSFSRVRTAAAGFVAAAAGFFLRQKTVRNQVRILNGRRRHSRTTA